jgi:regulator of protease activity HflC (stomatin/prohibitin superfamily)
MKKIIIASVALFALAGCQRIETGEVGVRIGFDKQIQPGELLPGSFNQTVIGDILTFPVKDISVNINDMTPPAKDNSVMKDFDLSVIYSVNASQVSELYSTKNRSFHATDQSRDVYLMFNYVSQLGRNAAYKAARNYEALVMNDNRQAMETEIKQSIQQALRDEKLDVAININQVLIRNIQPADSVVRSANDLVSAKNEFQKKAVEVETAKKEAERMNALANQSAASIAYMQAQAALNISEGIKNGKVQTIVVPANFNALMLNK